MRLSVNLEDDLYAVARSLARAEDCSLSAAVNRLVRRGLERASSSPGRPEERLSSFPTSRGARPITPDDVAAIEDEP